MRCVMVVAAGFALCAPVTAQTSVEWQLEGEKPVSLALAGMARQTLAWTDHGKPRSCEGVWLTDLLARAGAPVGDNVRGAALSTLVVAEAADSYRVVYTLGETDTKLGAARLLVADRCEGRALPDDEGPLRIIAPDESRGARSVRQLERISLVTLVPPVPEP